MQSVLAVSNLTKTYPPAKNGGKKFSAVKDISFTINEGEVLGLLGPNGAGKSSTIFMLLGVLTPTSGQINYFGKDFFKNRSEIMQQVSFASTYVRMPWRLSVIENLQVYGMMYGLNYQTFIHRAEKFLTQFGVWDQKDKTMNLLSAGQMTRIMLAKAFIPHPRLVLLDEPTASLDPDISAQVLKFIKHQQDEFGTSMLFTSHKMDEVASVCDRVIFMNQGKIVAEDRPENLAKTVSKAKLYLTFTKDELLAQKEIKALGYKIQLNQNILMIKIDEHKIGELLQFLSAKKLIYDQISIDKPSLEDYFIQMTQK